MTKKKLFLTPKSLVPYIKEYVKDISEYNIVEIDPTKSLPEILVEAGIFKNKADAKKNGYTGLPEAGFYTYIINETTITLLV